MPAPQSDNVPRSVPSRAELLALDQALRACTDVEHSDRVLFDVGARAGRELASAATTDRPLEERLRAALATLELLGYGSAGLLSFACDLPSGELHLAGEIRDSLETALGHASGRAPSHVASGFTSGLLGALASTLSGLDLACTPIRCPSDSEASPGHFEIRPSHRFGELSGPRHVPPGSPRFFLGAVGFSLGGSEVSLDDMLESTDSAVILIDNDDVVRYWNRGAERIFQFQPSEVVGRRIGRIVPADVLASGELDEMRARLDRGESVTQLLTRRVRKDGVERWCSVTRTPLHDAHGRVVGSTAILRDVTDQRRIEAELARSRALAAVGEMAAKLAHEVKNPLAGIYAAVQVLARDLTPDDPRRAIFDEIGAEVRRVDQTVIDLLRFSRPVPPKLAPHSLRAMVRDVSEPLYRVHPRVELRVDVPEDLLLSVDERMLSQAIENLVSNALQAVDGRGTCVVVGARVDADSVVLEVRDDGPGIPPNLREEIFEPFVTTKTRGTGLGLPIAAKNVAAHDGELSLEDAPEGGACFRIRLPRRCLVERS
jgi:PAS domain S-box-containing protein